MAGRLDIGLGEALRITMGALAPLPPRACSLAEAVGHVVAADALALVDSPSATASLKDGYAVCSDDVASASPEAPVRLRVTALVVAGAEERPQVRPGTCVQVMTGAAVPPGADAVLTAELTRRDGEHVLCVGTAKRGRNILPRGADVRSGEPVVSKGATLRPAACGLLAAAGASQVQIHPRPTVGLLATGDEVVAPGRPLGPGQLYASNIVTLGAWLRRFGMDVRTAVVSDEPAAILEASRSLVAETDAMLTSGGAWKSQRDRTVQLLGELGGQTLFHRVRLGPGKAVALTMMGSQPVFSLPGGPPSNEMAFLQIALPGLCRLAGSVTPPFPTALARIDQPLRGDEDWTQVVQIRLQLRDGELWATPIPRRGSRLRALAAADALVTLPEGTAHIPEGTLLPVQLLHAATP